MLGGYTDALPKPGTKTKDGPAYTGKQLFSLFFQKTSTMSLHQNGQREQKVQKKML